MHDKYIDAYFSTVVMFCEDVEENELTAIEHFLSIIFSITIQDIVVTTELIMIGHCSHRYSNTFYTFL